LAAKRKAKARAKARRKAPPAAPSAAMAPPPVRDRICNAAFGLFLEQGYEGTSTLAIATRAKVSKRELYALFRDKRDMFAAGVGARAQRMTRPLDLPPARDRAALAATLFAFGSTMLREATRPEVTAIMRLVVAAADRSPELAETFHKTGREPPRLALVAFLTRAKAAGLIGDADPERMAGRFLGLLMGDTQMQLMLRVASPPGEAEIERRARAVTDMVMALHPAP
jgi:AcrR family transcriptional regulator